MPGIDIWQHDLFLDDHSPYDKNELVFIKKTILEKNTELPE